MPHQVRQCKSSNCWIVAPWDTGSDKHIFMYLRETMPGSTGTVEQGLSLTIGSAVSHLRTLTSWLSIPSFIGDMAPGFRAVIRHQQKKIPVPPSEKKPKKRHCFSEMQVHRKALSLLAMVPPFSWRRNLPLSSPALLNFRVYPFHTTSIPWSMSVAEAEPGHYLWGVLAPQVQLLRNLAADFLNQLNMDTAVVFETKTDNGGQPVVIWLQSQEFRTCSPSYMNSRIVSGKKAASRLFNYSETGCRLGEYRLSGLNSCRRPLFAINMPYPLPHLCLQI